MSRVAGDPFKSDTRRFNIKKKVCSPAIVWAKIKITGVGWIPNFRLVIGVNLMPVTATMCDEHVTKYWKLDHLNSKRTKFFDKKVSEVCFKMPKCLLKEPNYKLSDHKFGKIDILIWCFLSQQSLVNNIIQCLAYVN